MTDKEKNQIAIYRSHGMSYASSVWTVSASILVAAT